MTFKVPVPSGSIVASEKRFPGVKSSEVVTNGKRFIAVTVPPGAKVGDGFTLTAPTGEKIHATVPQGYTPGTIIQ
jgi:hypothetical protein